MTIDDMISKYGWIGVLVLFALRELWPFFRQTVFPHITKREEEEQRWRHELDERQTKTLERLADAISGLLLAVTLQGQKLDIVSDAQNRYNDFVTQAIADMRETVAAAHRTVKEPTTRKVKTQ